MVVVFWLPFLRPWWWVFFPFFLSIELRKLYLWWIKWDYFYANLKWVTLEIVPPKEIIAPLKAMEDVFSVVWATLFDTPNWKDQWFDGILAETPYWMSWEIVSIEGRIHFYVRVMAQVRSSFESALYSHYPNLEIHEVPDYTKDVPQNVPNDEWDVYGEDFVLAKPAPYPIKTYENFFEPDGDKVADEEKRIDSMNSLLEMLAKLGPGEQFWLQFITNSTGDVFEPGYKKDAEEILSKLTGRAIKKKVSAFDEWAGSIGEVIFGPKREGSGEKATYSWVDRGASEEAAKDKSLTPGERDILTAVENKRKKPVFRTTMRGLYVAKRENWHPSNRTLTRAFFAHFYTQNLNGIKLTSTTRPKTNYVFRKRIPFIRARKMFRNAVLRYPPMFPDRKQETALLNTEEMATLFHFPVKISGMAMPTMESIQSKKGGPPPNLPTGE